MDEEKTVVPAEEIPFAHGLKLQDLLELGAFLQMLTTAPIKKVSEPAEAFRDQIAKAATLCMTKWVAANYPDADRAHIVYGSDEEVANDIFSSIVLQTRK